MDLSGDGLGPELPGGDDLVFRSMMEGSRAPNGNGNGAGHRISTLREADPPGDQSLNGYSDSLRRYDAETPRPSPRVGSDARGVDPRGVDPRGADPRGVDPRGSLEGRGLEGRSLESRSLEGRGLDPRGGAPRGVPEPLDPRGGTEIRGLDLRAGANRPVGLESSDDAHRMPELGLRRDEGLGFGVETPRRPEPIAQAPRVDAAMSHHPLVLGLLAALPSTDAPPPEGWMERWLEAARANLELIYGR